MSDYSPTQKVSQEVPERNSTIPLEIDKSQEVWGKLVSLNKLPSYDMIGKRKIVIGRASDCDFVIPDSFISSHHCEITVKENDPEYPDGIYVKDLSINGTFVDRVRLEKNKYTLLKNGSELILVLRPNIPGSYIAGYVFQDLLYGFTKRLDLLAIEEQDPLRSRYKILRELGRGHFGIVSLAVEKSSGNAYAVKEIDVKKYGPDKRRQFIVEAQFYERLHHACIPQLKEIIETKDMIYIIMELVTGGDLFDRIVQKKRYKEEEARLLMINLLSAVRYLHNQDIVHRDLKPENILLTYKGDDVSIKITDFGLAKHIDRNGLKTYCGTPQYFAPEVLQRRDSISGTGRYGKPVDMWSIGVILYFLLSGELPFDQSILSQEVRHAMFSFKNPIWETISVSAKHLIERLLDINPTTRITVDQALHHPWITNMPFIPSSLSQIDEFESEQKSQNECNVSKVIKINNQDSYIPPENRDPKVPSPTKEKNPFLCDSVLSQEIQSQSYSNNNSPVKFDIVKSNNNIRSTSYASPVVIQEEEEEEVIKRTNENLSNMEGNPDNPYINTENAKINNPLDEKEVFFYNNNMVNIYKAPSYVNHKTKSPQSNSNSIESNSTNGSNKRLIEHEEEQNNKETPTTNNNDLMKVLKQPVSPKKQRIRSPRKNNKLNANINDYFKKVPVKDEQVLSLISPEIEIMNNNDAFTTPSKHQPPLSSEINIKSSIIKEENPSNNIIPSSMSPENKLKGNSILAIMLNKEKDQANYVWSDCSNDPISDNSNTLPCQINTSSPQLITAFNSNLMNTNSIKLFQKSKSINISIISL